MAARPHRSTPEQMRARVERSRHYLAQLYADLDRPRSEDEIAAAFAVCHDPAPSAPQAELDLKPSA
jgi:hypothetical protein